MATGSRNSDSPLIRALLARPQEFRFFTVVQALERQLPSAAEVGTGGSPAEEPVRFSPSVRLSFPGSDLVSAKWADDKHGQMHVVAAFLGLYGVASPLPDYFQQTAASETPQAEALRAFLNIFDQRIYAFYYRAWKKHRLAESYDSRSQDRVHSLISGLSGLAQHERRGHKLFASAGIIGSVVRSASGLESVLEEYFRVPVKVTERVAMWRENPAPARLGNPAQRLGRSVAIGSNICDRAGSFRVAFGPLPIDDARTFLPGQVDHNEIIDVVGRYAPDFLTYEVHLKVLAEDAPAVKLGDTMAPLGWLSWLGRPANSVEDVSVGQFDAI